MTLTDEREPLVIPAQALRSQTAQAGRVCIVGSGWYYMSGISVYTCRLANAMAQTGPTSVILMRKFLPRRFYPGKDRAGAQLTDLRYDDGVSLVDNVDWHGVPGLFAAVRELVSKRPKMVVFEWWTGVVLHLYIALALLSRALGAKVVIEFHEVQDSGELNNVVARTYVRLFSRLLTAVASGYVVHSEHDIAAVADHYRLPVEGFSVVRHGPYDHLDLTEPADQSRGGADGSPWGQADVALQQATRLLYFGVIRPYKGLAELANAFSLLTPDEAATFRLTVVGEVWEGYSEPLDMLRRSPHADRITIVDRYVTDQELAAFLRSADAVVLPYRRSSASGPLHMAMSAGLPVVVSAVGSLAHATEGYPGAIVVRPEDPESLRDGLLAVRGATATRYVDSYTWEDTVQALRSLLPPGARSASATSR
jgi:glycosyltransferase involved in cell wall biosynthesis